MTTMMFTVIIVTAINFIVMTVESSSATDDDNRNNNGLPLEIIAQKNNKFALDMYRAMVKSNPQENIFFSPYSITSALSMLLVGADGNTAQQLRHALNSGSSSWDDIQRSDSILYNSIFSQKSSVILQTANKLFVQKKFDVLDSFLEDTLKFYRSQAERVDFGSDDVAGVINTWVESQTNNKIQNLFAPGSFDALTKLVLVNAVYFKAPWKYPFEKHDTKLRDFHAGVSGDDRRKVQTMFEEESLYYAELSRLHLDASILELPYEGQSMKMVIMLPNAKDGLLQLEQDLTLNHFSSFKDLLRRGDVRVFLPKFKLTESYDLKPLLLNLGVNDVFTEAANFSRISRSRDLVLSEAVHKAFVDVTEEGTEAAAATGMRMMMMSAAINELKFVADHPFMFYIQDNTSGAILFMGRLVNPQQEAQRDEF